MKAFITIIMRTFRETYKYAYRKATRVYHWNQNAELNIKVHAYKVSFTLTLKR